MLYTLHIILSTKMACICEAITEIQIKPHSVNQSVTHLLDETQLAPHTGCTTSTHWTCIRSHQHYHKYIESITKTNWIGCSLHGNPSSKTSLVITKRDCVLPSSTTLGPTDYRGHNFAKAPRTLLKVVCKYTFLCFNVWPSFCVSPRYFSLLVPTQKKGFGSLLGYIIIYRDTCTDEYGKCVHCGWN